VPYLEINKVLGLLLDKMFSSKEREYLKNNLVVNENYNRVLKYRIRSKLKQFFEVELPLLKYEDITEFYNGITENHNKKNGPEGLRSLDLTLIGI